MTFSQTFTFGLGSAETGLSLKAALVSGLNVIDPTHRDIAINFTERPSGSGEYRWYYNLFPDDSDGSVVFYVGNLGGAANFNGVTIKFELPLESVGRLESSLESLVGFSATGPNAVTLTITDGATAVQGARVAAKLNGVLVWQGVTNSSGQVSFGAESGVHAIVIVATGFNGYSSTITVPSASYSTIVLTRIAYTPSTPSRTTGLLPCYDKDGLLAAGIVVSLRIFKPSATGAYNDEARTATSQSNGYAEFTNLRPGFTYAYRYGKGTEVTYTIPTNAGPTTDLPPITGHA